MKRLINNKGEVNMGDVIAMGLLITFAVSVIIVSCSLIGNVCSKASSNYQLIDFTYDFNYAYIQLPNGEIVEGNLEGWRDYEGEQLQVKIDGTLYLTSSYNCVLVKRGET